MQDGGGRVSRPGGRARLAGAVLLALAAGFLVAYAAIGAWVDADGVLHEPFALIPLAWTAGLAGVASLGFGLWQRARAPKRPDRLT